MENDVSTKIRLLLNELAILNQPVKNGENFIYQKDTIEKVKTVCAELYLVGDQALLKGVFDVKRFSEPFLEQSDSVLEPTLNQEDLDFKEEVVPAVVETVKEIEVISEPEPIVEIPVFHEPKHELTDHHEKPKVSADEIASRISLTRRFEYINNLFAGNSELFMEFLDEIAYSDNLAQAMNVYSKYHDSHHWRRKGETAEDFKTLLKKVF
jgi:hypothetical protein